MSPSPPSPSSCAPVNTNPSRVQADPDAHPTGQARDAEKNYTSESSLAARLSCLDSPSMARPSLDPSSRYCDDSTLQRSSSSSAIPTLPSNASLPGRLLSTRWAGFTAASQPGPSLFFGYEPASALHTGPVSLTAPPSVSAGGHSSLYTSFPPASIASASEVSSTLLGASASVLSTTTLPAQSSRARSPHEPEFRSRPLPRLSRSVSDDALLSSHFVHSTSHSLRQQLSFLVDAWMADRENCLLEKQAAEREARRLQVSVEGDRRTWASDRSAMERQLKTLRARVHRLELENASLKTATMRNTRSDDMQYPRTALNGSSSQSEPDDVVAAAAAAAVSLSSNPSRQSNGSRGYVFSPPIETSCASRRPHFAYSGSSRTSPPGAPASCHNPHRQDRRQQPLHATADFMCPSGVTIKETVPVIDVQELDPKLEGIPIKANAVQKWTFSIAPNPRQSASKHRAGQGPGQCRARRQQNRRSMDRGRISRGDRQTSRDQTLQVLAVEESRRLTMHAGHTPNHSLSLLPTMTAAGGDSDGGRSTHGTDAQRDADACAGDLDDATQESRQVPARDVYEPPPKEDQNHHADAAADDADADDDADGEGFLGPCDDAPLKGPLMVKNIPAQDDLFFAQLDQKLEFVISGAHQDALPSVLRAPSPAGLQDQQPMGSRPAAGAGPRLAWDGAREGEDDVGDEGHEGEDLEPDVPLRLRSTANFGAPFGST
ncbi:hypothetical protein CP532_0647 [Ophiocordyceps camponoti-leonardi (nom. inval.)]|nr:hypothetical protein CP532_0647 [Ophiocordyceps camponoti-leonardi (nom. inval.)]